MSRQITNDAVAAFMKGKPFSRGNTTVTNDGDLVVLSLHGNAIARHSNEPASMSITLAGWPTPTTRERLNGIPGVHVWQKDGKQYLNNTLSTWRGNWTNVAQWTEPEKFMVRS